MAKFGTIFERTEKKYRITESQRLSLLKAVGDKLSPDSFGKSTVANIYFDTDDYRLIRASIEKPTVYKEKLRMRCYGNVQDSSNCFIELKKKYKGIVYKRRINMSYKDALAYLCDGLRPKKDSQILREIDYFLKFYPTLKPAVAIFYNRSAYFYKENPSLRITFDSCIRFRDEDTDLRSGSDGTVILGEDEYIMEIKCVSSMPLWLSGELDRLHIYPQTYSKYGTIYTQKIKNKIFK